MCAGIWLNAVTSTRVCAEGTMADLIAIAPNNDGPVPSIDESCRISKSSIRAVGKLGIRRLGTSDARKVSAVADELLPDLDRPELVQFHTPYPSDREFLASPDRTREPVTE